MNLNWKRNIKGLITMHIFKGGTFCKIQTFSINDRLIAGNQSIIN